MDRAIVNVWGSGSAGTVPVTATPNSASVGGVQQLIGNVWEWMSNPFGGWEPARARIETASPMRSIRGGGFDTYFDSQSHCQFQSGECPLARKHNIGFRCALGFGDVVQFGDLPASDSHEVHA
jgi:iron(II)-dependent oxidoreductase